MSRAEQAEAERQAEGPGPQLERERERQGLSRQQVAERLNLDVGVIEAIESENYAALGAPVFAKGHLRHYAVLLGLRADAVLEAYSHSQNQASQPTLVPKARYELPEDDRRPRWPWIVGGLLLFLAGAAAVAYVSEYGFRLPLRGPAGAVGADAPEAVSAGPTRVAAAEASDNTAAPESAQAAAVAPLEQAAPAAQAAVPQAGATGTSPVAAQPGQLELELRFTADSWVEIYDRSGQAVFYDLGRAGTARTVLAAAPLSVTLGNSGAVALSISGRAVSLPRPAPGQTVSRFSVDPEGTLR
jgi:cytoskeleton protein RodZ